MFERVCVYTLGIAHQYWTCFPIQLERQVWTTTPEQQNMIVDRILDAAHPDAPSEPPLAAQYLCAKLYQEFATLPEVDEMGYSARCVRCMPKRPHAQT